MHIDIDFISICKQMQTQSKLDIVNEKYKRTIIYGIVCLITKEKYVGSTILTLKERIDYHIRHRSCRAWQILERGNYKAYVIQHYPCNTRREKLTREGAWQRAYKKSFGEKLVNKNIDGSFVNESPEAKQVYNKKYREEHKDEIQVYSRKYRDEHKDERRAYDKKYRDEHKDERRAYDKQRYVEHKDEIQVYKKQYREEHKEEMRAYDKQYQKKPWTCEYCNKTMTTGAKSNHKRKTCKNKPVECHTIQ